MTIHPDRRTRAFCLFILGFALALLAAGGLLCLWQARAAQAMLLEHDRAVAGVLLAQGVPPDAIAAALSGADGSPEGDALLARIGRTEHTPAGLLPFLAPFCRRTAGGILPAALGLALLLAAGTACFVRGQERLYQQAADTVRRYAAGDSACRLPQLHEGTVYQLFAAVDQLAAMLASQNEAERSRKEFLKRTISDISHQLKTPLAALALYQELLAGEAGDPRAVREFAARSGQALERMERLIQSLLTLTRLDAGAIAFAQAPHPAAGVARLAVRELEGRAARERKTLVLDGPPDLTLLCDPDWTAEAVGNLVKNALDHTGPGGTVRVTWERTPALVRLCVEDDGSGIAPEDLPHIFKRFYRSRSAPGTPGVGLGLPLAKSIAEGQGGVLSVQSEPHKGTVFTLSFPASL